MPAHFPSRRLLVTAAPVAWAALAVAVAVVAIGVRRAARSASRPTPASRTAVAA